MTGPAATVNEIPRAMGERQALLIIIEGAGVAVLPRGIEKVSGFYRRPAI
jgi:hypothetical protein